MSSSSSGKRKAAENWEPEAKWQFWCKERRLVALGTGAAIHKHVLISELSVLHKPEGPFLPQLQFSKSSPTGYNLFQAECKPYLCISLNMQASLFWGYIGTWRNIEDKVSKKAPFNNSDPDVGANFVRSEKSRCPHQMFTSICQPIVVNISSNCCQIGAKSLKILCFPAASWRGFWLIALYRGCCIMGISPRTPASVHLIVHHTHISAKCLNWKMHL